MRSVGITITITMALCLLAQAVPALAKEPGWGRVYTSSGKVAVRENPSEGALQVRVLKAGQKVRVDFEENGWAAVFDPAETVRSEMRAHGYVRLAELRAGARVEPAPRSARAEGAEAGASDKKKEPRKAPEPAKAQESKQPKDSKAFGEIRVADRKLVVRAARDKDSAFKRLLQPGQKVRVDFQEDGFYAVFAPEEKFRDLSRAWGYGRDKYLVLEKDYAGEPQPEPAAPAAKDKDAPREPSAKSAQKQKRDAGAGDAVGYAVVDRHTDSQRPLAPVVLRVRIDAPTPPAVDALRKIMREIWKSERRKNEDLQLEVLLPGMDQDGLAYGVARFHDDGRIKEFWWRDVVLRSKR
ncbi:MAG: hypothetical protein KKA55_09490 [Proteobacteria bacterium]|nr:hypothetical protein [Pseudomonadota bacterium]MBU1595748.1 hypothetical protein [Pseudomonadota bacterium]